ncbi:Abscisic acid receptor PYL5 [Ananas comosus]|uniref:Abscisic acid receptor PYL5 n=1 Tax=Ananas comosus TaxID=4615 RepID=A0A199UWQ1_ANACO|nr:Abscisic acid receptor PYL5 [Ananas comosus]
MPQSAAPKLSLQPHKPSPSPAAAAAGVVCTAHEIPAAVARHHEHWAGPGQCCSAVAQRVAAPVEAVWSVVRRFDRPQAYKRFVRSCRVIGGGVVHVGALREVRVVSGLPAATSRERLEILDDERHVLSFRVVGGDHRLANYRSVTTLHAADDDDDDGGGGGGAGTVVVESYVVDVPPGNTRDDTRIFVDTIVRCNLQSLARTAQSLTTKTTSRAAAAAAAAALLPTIVDRMTTNRKKNTQKKKKKKKKKKGESPS